MTNLHIYYYPNFPLEIISFNDKKIYDELFHYIKNKKVIFISDAGKNTFLNISTNRNLNYFSVLNRGNFGYNGIEKLKNKLMEEKNVYFIIDTSIKCNDKFCQYMVEIPEYIQKNFSFIKKIGEYEIYYHEMK